MKKIFNCLTVALVGLMIAACSGGGNEFIKEAESKVEIKNRRASFDYEFLETYTREKKNYQSTKQKKQRLIRFTARSSWKPLQS